MNWSDRDGDGLIQSFFPPASATVKWVDVWYALRPADPGYTYDKERNTNVRTKKNLRVRLDRILLSNPDNIAPTSIRMVGTQPIKPGSQLYPSDHFGLLAEFEY